MALTSMTAIADEAQQLEESGFAFVHAGEHVQGRTEVHNSFVALSVAAGATTTVGLLSSVVLLPLYPAAVAAKLAAAVDVASGGRYRMGVGVGGEIPNEFSACGVRTEERGARTDEALEIIRRLWTEESVDFVGRFNNFSNLSIRPAPSSKPHPPIWVAGRRKRAMRRAAQWGDGWFPYMYSPEQLSESRSIIDQFGQEFERATPVRVGVWLPICCHPNRSLARQYVIDGLSNRYQQDFSGLVSKYAVFGSPDDCWNRLLEYIQAGATMVALVPFGPQEQHERTVSLVAQELLTR